MERRLNKVNKEQFIYWLSGVLDTSGQHITSATVDMIKNKLAEVMSEDSKPIARPLDLNPFKKKYPFDRDQVIGRGLVPTVAPVVTYTNGSDFDIDKAMTDMFGSKFATTDAQALGSYERNGYMTINKNE